MKRFHALEALGDLFDLLKATDLKPETLHRSQAPAQQALLGRAVPPPRGGAIAPPLGTALLFQTMVSQV